MKNKSPQWRISQKKIAQQLGADEVPGGGVSPGYGGDYRKAGEFLGEHKFTSKLFLKIKKEWLSNIWRDAQLAGLEPMFTCELGDGTKFKATIDPIGYEYKEEHWELRLLESLTLHNATYNCPFSFSFDGKILWKCERL